MNKKYVLEDQYLKEIKNMIKRADNLLLFLDYDGTLAPFNPDPKKAFALDSSVKNLKKLARRDGFYLSFISGRKLSELKEMIEIKKANYAGSHGLEIELYFEDQIIYPIKEIDIDKKSKRIYQIKKEEFILDDSYQIEDKGFGVALHFTDDLTSDFSEKLFQNLKKDFAETTYQVLKGRKIIEVRPAGWDKAKAVEYITEKIINKKGIEDFLTIYLGDDRTDEDVFAKLEDGPGIYIQNEDNLETAADYYLKDPADTAEFLGEISRDSFVNSS